MKVSSKKLIIEVDGGQHAEQEQEIYDETRTLYLNQHGFTILRFWNNQILETKETVLDEILRTANSIKAPSPAVLRTSTSPQRERSRRKPWVRGHT